MSHRKDKFTTMNDEKKDFEWNPPSPPWQSEPEPLSLRVTPDKDPEPEPAEELEVQTPEVETSTDTKDVELKEFSKDVPTLLFNGKPVNSEFSEESEDENGTELDGFFFYRIKCATGITLNGKHFALGAYWFNEETYDTMLSLDAPYQ